VRASRRRLAKRIALRERGDGALTWAMPACKKTHKFTAFICIDLPKPRR